MSWKSHCFSLNESFPSPEAAAAPPQGAPCSYGGPEWTKQTLASRFWGFFLIYLHFFLSNFFYFSFLTFLTLRVFSHFRFYEPLKLQKAVRRRNSPVRTDVLLRPPSLLDITVKGYKVPGSRPSMRQVKVFPDSSSGSQAVESSSANRLKLQDRSPLLNFTSTDSELEMISVKFTEQREASADQTWNRKWHHYRWAATISHPSSFKLCFHPGDNRFWRSSTVKDKQQ